MVLNDQKLMKNTSHMQITCNFVAFKKLCESRIIREAAKNFQRRVGGPVFKGGMDQF